MTRWQWPIGTMKDSSVSSLTPRELRGVPPSMLIESIRLLERSLGISSDTGLRLGGGTALAMLWEHRLSTDVDLAMPGIALQNAVRSGYGRIQPALVALREQGIIKQFRVSGAGSISWRLADGNEVSVSCAWGARSAPRDMEAITGIPLSPVLDILRGKLVGRAIGSGRLLARDGYDLCMATHREPNTFRKLIDEVHRDERDQLYGLMSRIQNSKRRIIEGRPLLDPSDPQMAHDPWGEFGKIVNSLIEFSHPTHEFTVYFPERDGGR